MSLFIIFIFIDLIAVIKIINNKNNKIVLQNNQDIQDISIGPLIKSLNETGKINSRSIFYESDELYNPIKSEYYSKESRDVYVYYNSSNVDFGDYHFSNPFIKREMHSLGIDKYKIVKNIMDVPKQSTLILFLSSPTKHASTYYKELKSIIGYDNYENQNEKTITNNYADPMKLKTYSRVYIVGISNEFLTFHMDLDLFLPSQRQYKLIEHPIRAMDVSHLSLFAKLASLNPLYNYSKNTMKFERQQFPTNRFRDNQGNQMIPTDEQCSLERSFVCELQGWGMISILHINTYIFSLSSYSNRMYILQQGNFQYGSVSRLFLPVSICDFYGYNRKALNKFQYNTTLDTKEYDNQNSIFMHASRQFSSLFSNFVPQEHVDNFPSNFAANAFYVDYFLTPSYQLREYVNQEILQTFKLPYGMPKHCISIHVRHGDKSREAEVFQFTDYVEILKALKTNITDIFVMSDDKGVIDESNQLNNQGNGEFYFHSLPNVNRIENKTKKRNDQHWDLNIPKSHYAFQFYAEAMIAARCEIFVGTISSNIGRLIVELQSLYEPFSNTSLKYVSLDLLYPKNMSYIPQTRYQVKNKPTIIINTNTTSI